MANNSSVTIGAQTGYTDLALKNGPTSLPAGITSRLTSMDAMIIGLTAFDPATYTIPRLLNMTSNDLIFALRNVYDAGNI